MTTRRELLKYLSVAGAVPAVGLGQAPPPKGPFTLPALPYAFDALEPHVDARTMEIHHDRHHAAYVNNLNAAVAAHPDWASKSLAQIVSSWQQAPEAVRTAVRNNGGGHANHTFFWNMMKKGGGKPAGELATAIDKRFGSLDAFKEQFTKAAMGVFGSGWAWLAKDASGALTIEGTANQDSPWMQGRTPVVGIDVWEHAYYLKHQNRRADYVAAWWNVVNWDFASEQFLKKG